MKQNDHYAAPGADETFLRPESGSNWAPREIAVCARPEGFWLSWIHREDGAEYPVLGFDTGAGSADFAKLCDASRFYSKPFFINHAGSAAPFLCVFAGSGQGCALRIYDGCDAGNPVCCGEYESCCRAVYHSDSLSLPDGSVYLVYSGVVSGQAGLGLFCRRKIAGEWLDEERLCGAGKCFNRPKLGIDGQDRVIVVADVFQNGQYQICWRVLAAADSAWQILYADAAWNMFPSLATDACGRLWASWLHVEMVRREDVAGERHHALLAVLSDDSWQLVRPNDEEYAADMNLGLLPAKRYFGYDGLRRYPSVAAMDSGEILLLWEQQKDEEEIWDNLHNGLLLGRMVSKTGFSPLMILAEQDCCFAVDSHCLHSRNAFSFASKAQHQSSGFDFQVHSVDLAACRPYFAAEVTRADWALADFRVEIRQAGKLSQATSSWKLFWGDLHCHSVHSPDAEGEIDELYHFAKEVARLDFVAITDNDFYPGKVLLDSETEYISAVAGALTTDDFLALSGYEWTFHRPDGKNSFNHRIVLFPENERETIRRNERSGNTEEAFAQYIQKTGYFSFPHHGYWEFLADEPAVEVTSAWGPYILDADSIRKNLQRGRKFAFLGNSDSHRFMPGLSGALTGVFAEELSREAIFSALRQGRCFATTGNRTVAMFYVDAAFIGGESRGVDGPLLRWQVCCHHSLEHIRIIRDGETVFCSECLNGEWRDSAVLPGSHWYYLEVKEAGDYPRYPHNVAPAFGKYLWTTPIRYFREGK